MKIAIAIAAIVFVLIVGGFIVWITTWKPKITFGPPPEETRTKINAAEDKAKKETDAKVEEVRDATLEDNLDRARDLVRRGMHGK